MDKFRTNYSLLDARPPIRQRNVRAKEAIASVSESVEEDPGMSICHHA